MHMPRIKTQAAFRVRHLVESALESLLALRLLSEYIAKSPSGKAWASRWGGEIAFELLGWAWVHKGEDFLWPAVVAWATDPTGRRRTVLLFVNDGDEPGWAVHVRQSDSVPWSELERCVVLPPAEHQPQAESASPGSAL